MIRSTQKIAFKTRIAAAALAIAALSAGMTDSVAAQDLSVFDHHGNLVRMPFEPDVPVVRTAVRQEGDSTSFLTYSSMPYQQCVDHYRRRYDRQDELAPGWTLVGYGFEVASNAYVFTLQFTEQWYRFEVHADRESGGCVLIVRSRGGAVGYQPYLHSLMPFRAVDVGPVPWWE